MHSLSPALSQHWQDSLRNAHPTCLGPWQPLREARDWKVLIRGVAGAAGAAAEHGLFYHAIRALPRGPWHPPGARGEGGKRRWKKEGWAQMPCSLITVHRKVTCLLECDWSTSWFLTGTVVFVSPSDIICRIECRFLSLLRSHTINLIFLLPAVLKKTSTDEHVLSEIFVISLQGFVTRAHSLCPLWCVKKPALGLPLRLASNTFCSHHSNP